jgi:hypothetical protein
MASSEVEICNSALNKLGAETIISFLDATKNARLCRAQYPLLRDELLRSHPWNFAISRVELAQNSSSTPEFEFNYEYIIPQDVLRILRTDLNQVPVGPIEQKWKIETNVAGNRILVTDAESVKIVYIKKITDVSLFDANFVDALAWRIAADLAYPIVQSTSLMQQMFQIYEQRLGQARSFDAMEGSLEQVDASDWVVTRF